jgi:hypothetical protein
MVLPTFRRYETGTPSPSSKRQWRAPICRAAQASDGMTDVLPRVVSIECRGGERPLDAGR